VAASSSARGGLFLHVLVVHAGPVIQVFLFVSDSEHIPISTGTDLIMHFYDRDRDCDAD
jgi:hypothetical protein